MTRTFRIRSFSEACALLEARGIAVTLLGRDRATGAIHWQVNGLTLDKAGVIAYAARLAAEQPEARP